MLRSDPPGAGFPLGVERIELLTHRDDRGLFAEVYRPSWPVSPAPAQWSLTLSKANTLRGMHVHLEKHDYVVVVSGQMFLGLHDLRPDSPTHRSTSTVNLDGKEWCAVRIPPGVAHGFYFGETATVLLGTSHEWSAADEMGCRWDDPALGVPWPCSTPILSERDRTAGSYTALEAELAKKA